MNDHVLLELYYDILGLTPNATIDEVEKAYKEKIKKYHSDVNKNEDATERTRQIILAHKTIIKVKLYDDLLNKKSLAKSENEFRALAKKFRDMGDYKDASALAKECEDSANRIKAERERQEQQKAQERERQYNTLLQQKETAEFTENESEFRTLAQQFRAMGKYKNAPELAKECEDIASRIKAKREERETLYNELLQQKKFVELTESESGFRVLAQQFRDIGEYKNASALAEECEYNANRLKAEREVQERKKAEEEQEARYNYLLSQKKQAKSESEFRTLAQQFRDMNNYKKSSELEKECENSANKIKRKCERRKLKKEAQYYNLLRQKALATMKDGWHTFPPLVKKFRKMNGYKDTLELAIECKKEAKARATFPEGTPLYEKIISYSIIVIIMAIGLAVVIALIMTFYVIIGLYPWKGGIWETVVSFFE